MNTQRGFLRNEAILGWRNLCLGTQFVFGRNLVFVLELLDVCLFGGWESSLPRSLLFCCSYWSACHSLLLCCSCWSASHSPLLCFSCWSASDSQLLCFSLYIFWFCGFVSFSLCSFLLILVDLKLCVVLWLFVYFWCCGCLFILIVVCFEKYGFYLLLTFLFCFVELWAVPPQQIFVWGSLGDSKFKTHQLNMLCVSFYVSFVDLRFTLIMFYRLPVHVLSGSDAVLFLWSLQKHQNTYFAKRFGK